MSHKPDHDDGYGLDVLQSLLDQGEDLSKPRHVMYFFYGDDVAPIRERLDVLGFETHANTDGDYWGIEERHRSMSEAGYDVSHLINKDCVVAERHEVIGENWRLTTLRNFFDLGAAYNVLFDGWQASFEGDASESLK